MKEIRVKCAKCYGSLIYHDEPCVACEGTGMQEISQWYTSRHSKPPEVIFLDSEFIRLFLGQQIWAQLPPYRTGQLWSCDIFNPSYNYRFFHFFITSIKEA